MRDAADSIDHLLVQVRACAHCEPYLPHGVRPVLQLHPEARILIAGQAPGRRVHETGIPFDDRSGDRLRNWLGVTRDVFYDAERIAILPMSFCYPGKGRSGDLPPRPECAPLWRPRLARHLANVEFTLLIGRYAQEYHLGGGTGTLTDTVRAWRSRWPHAMAVPHPSPRNNGWLLRNPWFETAVVPELRARVSAVLG